MHGGHEAIPIVGFMLTEPSQVIEAGPGKDMQQLRQGLHINVGLTVQNSPVMTL